MCVVLFVFPCNCMDMCISRTCKDLIHQGNWCHSFLFMFTFSRKKKLVVFQQNQFFLLFQGLPQVLLCRVHFLKEVLLLPALSSGDEKVIGGLACLMSEIGQAVSFFFICLHVPQYKIVPYLALTSFVLIFVFLM